MENCPLVFVGIGEILWDLLPGGRQFGGAPANFAYHAKALARIIHELQGGVKQTDILVGLRSLVNLSLRDKRLRTG